MSRSARHLLHFSGLRSGRAGGGRVGEDALAVLVGDDRRQRRFGRRSRPSVPSTLVVVSATSWSCRRSAGQWWPRRPARARRRVSPARGRPRGSPACSRRRARGSARSCPGSWWADASIWYVVMAAGSTLLITPASSSILRGGQWLVGDDVLGERLDQHARDRWVERALGEQTAHACAGGSPVGARCVRGRTCRPCARRRLASGTRGGVIVRRRGRGRR